jgi:NADPH2:quinone reductase
VAYTTPNGAYATHRLINADLLVHLPDDVDEKAAAGAMLKGLTAHYLLHDSFAVETGHKVLFHAAAGGVGSIAGQWLRAKGVEAFGTAGGAEKCELARSLGYTEAIDYRSEDFVARVKELTGEVGVDAVYDSVGKDTLAGSLDCLKTFGTLVSFGQSSGLATDFKISDLARGSLRLTRPTLFHFTAKRAWLEAASADLFSMIASGKIDIRIDQTYPMEEAALAHEALESRKTTGSTILIP